MAVTLSNKQPWGLDKLGVRLSENLSWERSTFTTIPFDLSSSTITKLLTRFNKQLHNPYGQHPVVNTCVRLLARNISGVRFKIMTAADGSEGTTSRSVEDNKRMREEFLTRRLGLDPHHPVYPDMTRKDSGFREVEKTETPLVPLFTSPNPNMTGAQFWDAVVSWLSLNGETDVVAKDRMNVIEIPKELWPMDPRFFTPLPRGVEYPSVPLGWEFRKGSAVKGLINEELIRPRIFNNVDPLRGLAPLNVADITLQGDWSGRLYNVSFFDNDATPGGVIMREHAMNRKARLEWIEDWNKQHGGALNAFKWALIDGATKVIPLGTTFKDMQFPELRKMSKEEFAMIWGIPLVLLSNTETIPNAKDKAERKGFWTDTLIPIIRHLEDIFWAELFQHIDGGKYWGAFDLSKVDALQEDFQAKLDQAKTLFDMHVPFDTINERLNMGFEPIPGGDTAIAPINMIPIEAIVGGATIPAQTDNAQEARVEAPYLGTEIEECSGCNGMHDDDDDDDDLHNIQRADPTDASIQKNFDKVLKPLEEQFTKKYRRWLFEYRKAVLASIDTHIRSEQRAETDELADLVLLSEERWNDKLTKAVGPVYVDVVDEAARITADEISAPVLLTATSPELIRVVNQRQIKVVGTNETLRKNLKRTIAEGLTEGETTGQIQTRVRQVMNFQDRRALTIARTEVGSAASTARFNSMEENGVKTTSWQTAGFNATPKPRSTHIQAQGVGLVKVGKTFAQTKCRFPLDPLGPADQVINCRCVSIPGAVTIKQAAPSQPKKLPKPVRKKKIPKVRETMKSAAQIVEENDVAANKYLNILPDQPRESIEMYQTTSSYVQINGALRGEAGVASNITGLLDREFTQGAKKTIQSAVSDIDKGLRFAPTLKEDTIVYRGMVLSSDSPLLKSLTPNSQIIDYGYVSTSLDRKVASDFLQDSIDEDDIQVLLKIRLEKGSSAAPLPGEEAQLLLPRYNSEQGTGALRILNTKKKGRVLEVDAIWEE